MKKIKKLKMLNLNREASIYANYILNNYKFDSCFDIGCGDALLESEIIKHNNEILYNGIDINSGIYEVPKKNNIEIVKSRNDVFKKKEKYDAIFLFDVLEHDDNFFDLLDYSMNISKKYIFLSIPNEGTFQNRLKFLFSGKIDSMGFEQLNKPLNHRHLWCVNPKEATNLIETRINKNKFFIKEEINVYQFSNKFFKRLIQNFLNFFIFPNVMISGKLLIISRD